MERFAVDWTIKNIEDAHLDMNDDVEALLLIEVDGNNEDLLFEEIEQIVRYVDKNKLVLMHTVSTYPAKTADLHIDTIDYLKRYQVPVGYSGHELGKFISAALALKDIDWLERHFTSDKTLWGTDQSCSLETHELKELIGNMQMLEKARGTRVGVLECEIPILEKLR